jgi:hypothetical protein
MIIVTSPEKPLELTSKGSVRRNVCLCKYESEIEELYKLVEESAQSGPQVPAEWTSESTLDFVRAVVHNVMEQQLDDNVDLFQHGCDRFACFF